MISRNTFIMKHWLAILLFFLFLPHPVLASEPAHDTLPPELVRLRDEGRLTVRALWAWKLVPESTAATAMEFRVLGLDLIGADRSQLATWIREADEGGLVISPTQRDVLSALMETMDSGQSTTPSEIASQEPAAVSPDVIPPVLDTAPGVAMYRGGAARTGVAYSLGPAGPPVELWKLKVGDGPCTAPVVLGGVVYFGSVDGHLYAVDVAAGVLKWKFFAEDWVDQPPAMASGMVFFGNVMGDKSGDRHLFALEAATGSEKWRFKSRYYGVNSSPAIVDGTVCFGAGKHFYTADPQTGVEKWSFEATDSVRTPAIAGGTAFFAHANRLTAVDLGADAEKWTFRAAANITTCPAVLDGMVYFGSDDFNMYAVDVQMGQEIWKFGTGLIHHPPAVHEGVVYVVSSDNLHALDAATGAVKWTVNTQHSSLKAPVVQGDTLFLAAGKFLMALDRTTGRERWRYETGGDITSPALADGVAYFWSEDGHLYAVR
jgi:hypothetical protein